MPVVKETNEVFVKGVEKTIFEASGLELPGFFSGEIDLTQLSNVADEMKIRLQIKYSAAGVYREFAQPTLVSKQADLAFVFTPKEETYGYKILGELLAASPSATATLELKVLRSNVPV